MHSLGDRLTLCLAKCLVFGVPDNREEVFLKLVLAREPLALLDLGHVRSNLTQTNVGAICIMGSIHIVRNRHIGGTHSTGLDSYTCSNRAHLQRC